VEEGQGGGGVAGQRNLGRVVAPDLVGVDIEVDQSLTLGQTHALPAGADRQHDVGGVNEGLDPAVDPGRAHRQWVAIVDGPLAFPRRDHRGLQELDHGAQRVGGVTEHHAAAGDDDRALRRRQQVGGLGHDVGVGGHRRHVRPDQQRDLFALDESLGWNFNLSRAGSTARHFEESPPHRGGDGMRLQDPLGPLGDGTDHVELVVDVVEQTEVLADAMTVDLAGQEEHRGGAGVGSGQAGGRVVDADTGDDHGHSRASRGAGVAVSHVRSALLVAGHDVTDLRCVDQGVECRHELVARETEDHLDPLVDQLAGQRLTSGHGGGCARGLCGGIAHRLVHHSGRMAATWIMKGSQCSGGPAPPKVDGVTWWACSQTGEGRGHRNAVETGDDVASEVRELFEKLRPRLGAG
jgi:hypothetical protein